MNDISLRSLLQSNDLEVKAIGVGPAVDSLSKLDPL